MTCSLSYWRCETCCNGMDVPWGFSPVSNFRAATSFQPIIPGSVRAWHFLADKGADVTKVWSVEKDDVLNVLVYEFKDSLAGTATANQVYQYPASYRWKVFQMTVTGAVQTTASAAGALALLLFS